MPKPTVVVIKSGSPCYVGGTGTARGDADTPAIIEHLVERGDLDVVFFGAFRGEIPGCRVMDPDLRGIFDPRIVFASDADKIDERCKPYVDELRELGVACYIDSTGPEVSWSWPKNDQGASLMISSARYGGPAKRLMHLVPSHRICVVTDPKCYPRDGEFARMWPSLLPHAVLSQEQRVFDRRVSYVDYKIHTVRSGAEYWLTHRMEPIQNTGEWQVVVAANTHVTDPRVGGHGKRPQESDRALLWEEVLSRCDSSNTRICGSGWDKTAAYERDPAMFVGILPTMQDVREFLSTGVCGPMITQRKGFASTKPRLYALSGSVPRFAGDYDCDAVLLPQDHPARWGHQSYDIVETLELILERTRPNFSLLDRVVDECVAGRCTWPDPAWLATFGGYVCVGR